MLTRSEMKVLVIFAVMLTVTSVVADDPAPWWCGALAGFATLVVACLADGET
jgi:hypothetical protein